MEFDLLLKGGAVVDTAHQVIRIADVGIKDGTIVFVGAADEICAKSVFDCAGRYITAGFIDAHVHIESGMVLPSEFGEAVLRHGTTCVIADPHEIVNVAGASGLDLFLELAAEARIDIFTTVPSAVPATPFDTNGAGRFLAEDMKKYLGRKDIVGLGEVMCYNDILNGEQHIFDKLALFKGMTIDGHTAGMPEDMLPLYAGAGVMNDHESTCYKEALLRYESGMNVYIREGSAARNLESIIRGVIRDGLDIRRFAFCTDDKHLCTIAAEGHISYNVKKALSLGMNLLEAATIACDNPARFYNLADRGRIEVGLKADMVVLSDQRANSIEAVVKDGKLVFNSAEPELYHKKRTYKQRNFENTVKFAELSAADFAPAGEEFLTGIRLIPDQILTKSEILSRVEAEEGVVAAVVERYGKTANLTVCPLLGYGIGGGAIATSVSHDSHNVVIAGDNGEDMAVAAREIKRLGGGYVLAAGGRVVDELPLPVFGLMSDKSAVEVEAILEELEHKARAMGVLAGIDPFTTLSFIALPVIPEIRLLDTGLFDVLKNKFIE